MGNNLRHFRRTAFAWALLLGWATLVGAQSVGLPAPRLLTAMLA